MYLPNAVSAKKSREIGVLEMLSHCPHQEELQDFAIGNVSEQRLSAVAEHLSSCPKCTEILTSPDDFADSLESATEGAVRNAPGGATDC